jgi:hypothetical protein
MNDLLPPLNGRLAAIERALAELDAVTGDAHKAPRQEIPFYGPTLLASMTELDQALAQQAEQARYEENPQDSAIHFCLVSAVALLEVSQALLNQSSDPTPQERERQWKTLVAYIKTAGRSAYRAASILTDKSDT